MRVNRVVCGIFLLCCACLNSLSLQAQTLLTPSSRPKPLSSEQPSSNPDNPLHTSNAGILTVDAAFGFKAVVEANALLLSWAIQPGYYLYQSKLDFNDSQGKHFTVELPRAEKIVDEFLGESLIYVDSLQVRIPLARLIQNNRSSYSLTVQFQGCAKDRYCYPPQTKTIPMTLP